MVVNSLNWPKKKQIDSSLIIILVLGGLIAASLVKTHYKANETKIGQVVRRNLELFKKEVKKEDGKKLKRILKKHIFFQLSSLLKFVKRN